MRKLGDDIKLLDNDLNNVDKEQKTYYLVFQI